MQEHLRRLHGAGWPSLLLPPGVDLEKKQTSVSHSSPEAELVALDCAIREEGIPALDLWATILGKEPKLYLYEDNQAAAKIVKSWEVPETPPCEAHTRNFDYGATRLA